MNTGTAPRNCTLYALASRNVKPRFNARRCSSSVSNAASFSCPKDHSYGYEMNGKRSGHSTACAFAVAASSMPTGSCPTRSPSCRSSSYSPEEMNASNDEANTGFT